MQVILASNVVFAGPHAVLRQFGQKLLFMPRSEEILDSPLDKSQLHTGFHSSCFGFGINDVFEIIDLSECRGFTFSENNVKLFSFYLTGKF